ncbi:MAG: lipoyl protein ligase domain-containing protein, partial [Flavobacteriaceae bacterium]
MKQNKEVKIIELGQLSYGESLTAQEQYFNQIIALKRANRTQVEPLQTPNYLLWVEHPPVVTLGKSGKKEHLLLDAKGLEKQGIEFF